MISNVHSSVSCKYSNWQHLGQPPLWSQQRRLQRQQTCRMRPRPLQLALRRQCGQTPAQQVPLRQRPRCRWLQPQHLHTRLQPCEHQTV